MKLVNQNPGFKGYPTETTLEDLTEFARKKLGARFLCVKLYKYGGGDQVEVRSVKDGYHGRQMVREACYNVV